MLTLPGGGERVRRVVGTIEDQTLDRLESWVEAPVGMTCDEALGHLRRCAGVAFSRLEAPADGPAERAARTLFRDVRFCFPLARQATVWLLVLRACRHVEDRGVRRARLSRAERRCPVVTRSGTPCRRDPLSNGWCPSHQHLREERFSHIAVGAA